MDQMEKKRYSVSIAGCDMYIVSDEREEVVEKLVASVDSQVKEILKGAKSCSKLDAALLVALENANAKAEAEKRVRNLETQIKLYDTNLRRAKDENARLKASMLDNKPVEISPEEPETAATVKEEKEDMQVKITEDIKEETSDSKKDKLSQIENLLRGRGI